MTPLPKSLLERLGATFHPTKHNHNYLPCYARHLEARRRDVKKVLEIGVQTDKSVRLWKSYFPNAEIVGFDIDPKCKAFEEDRIEIIIGDQGDPDQLRDLPRDFDVIIDDGSHLEDHQILSFETLYLDHLNNNGIFFMEDVEGRDRTIEWFKRLVNEVNYLPPGFDTADWHLLNSFPEDASEYAKNILSAHFYRYLIVVEKGHNPQQGEAAVRLNK